MQSYSLNQYDIHVNTILRSMQHLVSKTGLGLAVSQAIEDLGLQRDRDNIKGMLLFTFTSKFEAFKRAHSARFQPQTVRSTYLVENQFPVGENDIHQYFKCLAYEVKIGSGSLTIGTEGNRRPFTMIEGFSRNQDSKKRSLSRPLTQRVRPLSQRFSRSVSGGSHSTISRQSSSSWRLSPLKKMKIK